MSATRARSIWNPGLRKRSRPSSGRRIAATRRDCCLRFSAGSIAISANICRRSISLIATPAADASRSGFSLAGVDAHRIDGSIAAAAIAFKAHLPGVVALGIGKVRLIRRCRRRIAAADRALAGGTSSYHDDPAVTRQVAVIVHDLVAADGGRLGRLLGMIVVVGHASDKRSDPPRLLQ